MFRASGQNLGIPKGCRPVNVENYLGHRVNTHSGSIDLDFVGVHGRVGNQDFRILYPLGLPNSNPLVKDESLIKE